jgi:hypothetical protein
MIHQNWIWFKLLSGNPIQLFHDVVPNMSMLKCLVMIYATLPITYDIDTICST